MVNYISDSACARDPKKVLEKPSPSIGHQLTNRSQVRQSRPTAQCPGESVARSLFPEDAACLVYCAGMCWHEVVARPSAVAAAPGIPGAASGPRSRQRSAARDAPAMPPPHSPASRYRPSMGPAFRTASGDGCGMGTASRTGCSAQPPNRPATAPQPPVGPRKRPGTAMTAHAVPAKRPRPSDGVSHAPARQQTSVGGPGPLGPEVKHQLLLSAFPEKGAIVLEQLRQGHVTGAVYIFKTRLPAGMRAMRWRGRAQAAGVCGAGGGGLKSRG